MDSSEEVVEQNSSAVPQRQASVKRRRAYAHTKLALAIIGVIGVVAILGRCVRGAVQPARDQLQGEQVSSKERKNDVRGLQPAGPAFAMCTHGCGRGPLFGGHA